MGSRGAKSEAWAGGRYRECMRNHAVAMGGQAYDGCGEFMPDGACGSLESLKCAACGCHRNFHRREDPRRPLFLYNTPAFFPPITTAVPLGQQGRAGSDTPPRAEVEEQHGRKRVRTKFTAEQKERMRSFADRLGWRIQGHDGAVLEAFCREVGLKRHVLKVWMHNNKHGAAGANPSTAAAEPAAHLKPEPVSNPLIHV